MPIRGVIFDLDGTLIDSRLDFDAMRRDMGFSPGQLILETLESLSDANERARCEMILARHEREGALCATPMPGARELLDELVRRDLSTAILTRNSRAMTELALNRLNLAFSHVLTREDAPPKPDPAGLLQICRRWGFSTGEVLFVGDYHFDLLAGRAAGIPAVLYSPDELPHYSHDADFIIRNLMELIELLDRLDQRIPNGR